MSVRRVVERAPDGRLIQRDVVGDLVGLDAQTAVVESRTGLIEIPVGYVTAARIAEPSTADELALEGVASRGMRAAETAELGGWLLRADHGFLRRANSVLPLRQLGMPLDEALTQAREWYADRGLPLVIATQPEARRLLDADLGERGWTRAVEAHLMAARLDAVVEPAAGPDPRIDLADTPSDAWLAVYRGGEGVSDEGRALLARHDTVAFVSLVDEGRVLATGRGAVDDGWLGVSGVEVVPEARRQGLASAVMAALWAWGRDHGATRSYLQVEIDNLAAITLYERLGYWVHHDYRYRVDPPPGHVPDRLW